MPITTSLRDSHRVFSLVRAKILKIKKLGVVVSRDTTVRSSWTGLVLHSRPKRKWIRTRITPLSSNVIFGEFFKPKRVSLYKSKAQQKKTKKKQIKKISGKLQAKLRRAKGRAQRKSHIPILELFANLNRKKIRERERKLNRRVRK